MDKQKCGVCLSAICPNFQQCEECVLEGMLKHYMEYVELGTVDEVKDEMQKKTRSLKEHNERYRKFLSEGNTSWDSITEAELETIPFPITNPETTLRELKELNPYSFLFFSNKLIKQLIEQIKIPGRCKDQRIAVNANTLTYASLVAKAYQEIGSLIEDCQIDYYNTYEMKTKYAMEIFAEYPEARYQIINYFSRMETNSLFADEEIKAKQENELREQQEAKEKRAEKVKRKKEARQANLQTMERFGFVLKLKGRSSWGEGDRKLIIDKESEEFINRKDTVSNMMEDVAKRYSCNDNVAMGMITEKMPNYMKIRDIIRSERITLSRPETIACSECMFKEFKESYDAIMRAEKIN